MFFKVDGLKTTVEQLQSVSAENFNYFECLKLIIEIILRFICIATCYLIIPAVIIALMVLMYKFLPKMIIKITDEDRTLKGVVQNQYHSWFTFEYMTDKWESKLLKRRLIKIGLVILDICVGVLLIIPFFFSDYAIRVISISGVAIAMFIFILYIRLTLGCYDNTEKDNYEQRVVELLKSKIKNNDDENYITKINKELEKHPELYKYDVVMKK